MSIHDVVDALFSLPPDKLKEPERPPKRENWRMVHGNVAGRLFMMAGSVNRDGEWERVEIVAPVWPPDLGWEE